MTATVTVTAHDKPVYVSGRNPDKIEEPAGIRDRVVPANSAETFGVWSGQSLYVREYTEEDVARA